LSVLEPAADARGGEAPRAQWVGVRVGACAVDGGALVGPRAAPAVARQRESDERRRRGDHHRSRHVWWRGRAWWDGSGGADHAASVRDERASHPTCLLVSERRQARVRRVVHEVLHRVAHAARAAVGAIVHCRGLRRRVADQVARLVAEWRSRSTARAGDSTCALVLRGARDSTGGDLSSRGRRVGRGWTRTLKV
jgi:hypothetical protein